MSTMVHCRRPAGFGLSRGDRRMHYTGGNDVMRQMADISDVKIVYTCADSPPPSRDSQVFFIPFVLGFQVVVKSHPSTYLP